MQCKAKSKKKWSTYTRCRCLSSLKQMHLNVFRSRLFIQSINEKKCQCVSMERRRIHRYNITVLIRQSCKER